MRHKVSELEGALLDAAVAKAEGAVWKIFYDRCAVEELGYAIGGGTGCWLPYEPSIEWMQGGPIIARERISLEPAFGASEWAADADEDGCRTVYGPTALIAAMRAYVASKFGDEVELP